MRWIQVRPWGKYDKSHWFVLGPSLPPPGAESRAVVLFFLVVVVPAANSSYFSPRREREDVRGTVCGRTKQRPLCAYLKVGLNILS